MSNRVDSIITTRLTFDGVVEYRLKTLANEFSIADHSFMLKAIDTDQFHQRLKARDAKALEILVRAYTQQIYNTSLGLGFSPTESDDLTQNVWLTFFDILDTFEGRSKIRTFLFGILYNKASELRKKNKKFDVNADIEDLLDRNFDQKGQWIQSPKDPESFLMVSQNLQLIATCLELLPLNQKMAFALKEIENEITEDICKILNVNATHLGVLLFRARTQLRECIEKKSE